VEITFTHTGGGKDWVHVLRDDGTPLRWPWPSYGTGLPHDLLHYVVETRLNIRHGFWGLVADGVDFGYLSRVADQIHAGAEPDRRPGVDLSDLVRVECVLQALQGGSDAECLRRVRECCTRHAVAVPPGLTEVALRRLRAEVGDLAARWQPLAAGRSLVLPYTR
jgi:hypothetical protein